MNGSIRVGKSHLAGPRAGILAVAATLALAATASASGKLSPAARQDLGLDGPVSYPATYAVPLDASAKEAKRLNSILMESEFIRRIKRIQDAASQDQIVKPFLRGPKTWGRIPLPADLSRTMGGAELYVLRGDGRVHELLCLAKDTLYRLPYDLNQLLKDSGMKFSNADVHRWTPLVIVVSLACDRFSVEQSGENLGPEAEYTFDSIVRGQIPLTPSVTLNKLVADTASATDQERSANSVMPGFVSVVRADVQIDGRSSTINIYTAGASPQDDAAYPVMFVHPTWNLFMSFSVPKLSMLDVDSPELEITGDGRFVYQDPGIGLLPYYAIVRDERAPSGVTLVCHVKGFEAARTDVYVRYSWRSLGHYPFWFFDIHVDIDGNGEGSGNWSPPADFSGTWKAELGWKTTDGRFWAFPGTGTRVFLECSQAVTTESRLVFRIRYCKDFFGIERDWDYIDDYIGIWLGERAITSSISNQVRQWGFATLLDIERIDDDDTFDVFLAAPKLNYHGFDWAGETRDTSHIS